MKTEENFNDLREKLIVAIGLFDECLSFIDLNEGFYATEEGEDLERRINEYQDTVKPVLGKDYPNNEI